MDRSLRRLTEGDREEGLWVEAGATPAIRYLDDVWTQFIDGTDEGDLSGVFMGGKLVGLGKLTRLFDHYGWLEALRVHPDYQRQGIGKTIYQRYFEEMTERRISAVGMYTGAANATSRGLAELFGLEIQGRFTEYQRPVRGVEKMEGGFALFPIYTDEAEAAMAPYYRKGRFLVINRTFYPLAPGLGDHLSRRGWLYWDGGDGMLVTGARFQVRQVTHINILSGDPSRLLPQAVELARRSGSAVASAAVSVDDPIRGALQEEGFQKNGADFITLWRGL